MIKKQGEGSATSPPPPASTNTSSTGTFQTEIYFYLQFPLRSVTYTQAPPRLHPPLLLSHRQQVVLPSNGTSRQSLGSRTSLKWKVRPQTTLLLLQLRLLHQDPFIHPGILPHELRPVLLDLIVPAITTTVLPTFLLLLLLLRVRVLLLIKVLSPHLLAICIPLITHKMPLSQQLNHLNLNQECH